MPILKNIGIDTEEFANTMMSIESEFVIAIHNIEYILKQLQGKYKIVCLTNWFGSIAKEKLEKTNLMKYISAIYTCEDNYAKPNPIAFTKVLEKENLNENEAIMIGDTYTDIISSKYRIQSILMDYDDNKKAEVKDVATAVVTETMDLCKILI